MEHISAIIFTGEEYVPRSSGRLPFIGQGSIMCPCLDWSLAMGRAGGESGGLELIKQINIHLQSLGKSSWGRQILAWVGIWSNK